MKRYTAWQNFHAVGFKMERGKKGEEKEEEKERDLTILRRSVATPTNTRSMKQVSLCRARTKSREDYQDALQLSLCISTAEIICSKLSLEWCTKLSCRLASEAEASSQIILQHLPHSMQDDSVLLSHSV